MELIDEANEILKNLEERILATARPATMYEQMETAAAIRDGLHEMETWTHHARIAIFSKKMARDNPFSKH